MSSLQPIRAPLASLRQQTADLPQVSLATLTGILAAEGFLFVHIFFFAANIVFAPLPFSSWIFGWPLLIATWLELRGATTLQLPHWIGRRCIPAAGLKQCLDWIDRELDRLEPWLTTPARPTPQLEACVPWVCFALCLILMMPVPFLNIPPLLAMLLLQVGRHVGHPRLLWAGLVMSVLTLLGLAAFGLVFAGLLSL